MVTRAGLGSSAGVQLGSRNRPGPGRWPGGEEERRVHPGLLGWMTAEPGPYTRQAGSDAS